jgi:hypothetical protein
VLGDFDRERACHAGAVTKSGALGTLINLVPLYPIVCYQTGCTVGRCCGAIVPPELAR